MCSVAKNSVSGLSGLGGGDMMPLGLLTIGERADVIEIRGNGHGNSCCSDSAGPDSHGCSCRIEDMGLRAGKTVEMLNNEGRGALLIKIDEARIAIGRGMAMKIMVRRQE